MLKLNYIFCLEATTGKRTSKHWKQLVYGCVQTIYDFEENIKFG